MIKTEEQFIDLAEELMSNGMTQDEAATHILENYTLSEDLNEKLLSEGIYMEIRTQQIIEQSLNQE